MSRNVRFTFLVPEPLHRKFKAACALQGKDMSEVGRYLIKEWTQQMIDEPKSYKENPNNE